MANADNRRSDRPVGGRSRHLHRLPGGVRPQTAAELWEAQRPMTLRVLEGGGETVAPVSGADLRVV